MAQKKVAPAKKHLLVRKTMLKKAPAKAQTLRQKMAARKKALDAI